MTIVVTVRVNDGIVLAADSATSFIDADGNVVKVYNNANKIFNLVKGWPIGAVTYGAGSIGAASISTLSKDLRGRLTPPLGLPIVVGGDPRTLDQRTYTIEQTAEIARDFFEEKYKQAYAIPVPGYRLRYRVCVYSAVGALPEAWEIRLLEGKCEGPERLYEDNDFGPRWQGQNEAIDRLVLGIGSNAIRALLDIGVDEESANKALSGLAAKLYALLYLPAMPIQDAIELAHFLVETAVKFAHFSMHAATVGGPIEIATISKHEGFKWVRRKHYYSTELNPEG